MRVARREFLQQAGALKPLALGFDPANPTHPDEAADRAIPGANLLGLSPRPETQAPSREP